jgi:CBS-domain-containing membrane protein
MRVRDVMTTTVVTAGPDTPFVQLVDLMLRHGISGIPILDDDENLIGIVTEADLVSKEAYGGRRRPLGLAAGMAFQHENVWATKAGGLTAEAIMSSPVRTVHADDLLRLAAARMVATGVKRLPVVSDEGRVVGIVSRFDVLRAFHRTDGELALEVQQVLDDPLRTPRGHKITHAEHEGVVTLYGTVRLPSHVRVVETTIRGLAGVVDVVDHMTVAEESAVAESAPSTS